MAAADASACHRHYLAPADDWLVGDLGHPRVDARLLSAVLLHDGRVSMWLQDRGVSINDLQESFPDTKLVARSPTASK